jgi:hypothetical protein
MTMQQPNPRHVNLQRAISNYEESLNNLRKQLQEAEQGKARYQKWWENFLKPLFAPVIICCQMVKECFKVMLLPLLHIVNVIRHKNIQANILQHEAAPRKKNDCQQAILNTLYSRDLVEIALQNQHTVGIKTIEKLQDLDSTLKRYETKISHNLDSLDLDDWRKLSKVEPRGWWWFIIHPLDQYDNLWGFLTIALLVFSLVLAADLTPRFFKGGPNFWGTFSALVPAILTWLFSKDSIERAFQTRSMLENRLRQSNTNKLFQQEIIFVISFILLTCMIIAHSNMENIAEAFYRQSKEIVDKTPRTENLKLGDAEANLLISLAFNSDHTEAHNLLGRVYTLRGEMKKAKDEYKIAASRNSILAAARLKRLQLFEKKVIEYPFYQISLPPRQNDQEQEEKKTNFLDLLFNLLKNLILGIWNLLISILEIIRVIAFGYQPPTPEEIQLDLRQDIATSNAVFAWENLERYKLLNMKLKTIQNKLLDKKSKENRPDLEKEQSILMHESNYFFDKAKGLLGYDNSNQNNGLIQEQEKIEKERRKFIPNYPSSALPKCLWAELDTISHKSKEIQENQWYTCLHDSCSSTVLEEEVWQYIAFKNLMQIAPSRKDEFTCGA